MPALALAKLAYVGLRPGRGMPPTSGFLLCGGPQASAGVATAFCTHVLSYALNHLKNAMLPAFSLLPASVQAVRHCGAACQRSRVAARANPKPEHLELSRDCDLQSLSSPGPRLLQLVKVVLFYEGLDIATPSTHAGSVCRPCGSRFKGFPRERTSRRSSRWTTCGAGGMAGLSRFVEQAQLVTAVLSWLHGVAV